MLVLTEDPFARPQFRWVSEPRHPYRWSQSRPIELRISFKSINFIRVSIETLYACGSEQKYDACVTFPGR